MPPEQERSKPSFLDDRFLDAPPFSTKGYLEKEVYEGLCETFLERMYTLLTYESLDFDLPLALPDDSVARYAISTVRGEMHVPNQIAFKKMELVLESGPIVGYGFEINAAEANNPREVRNLLRYAFLKKDGVYEAFYIYPMELKSEGDPEILSKPRDANWRKDFEANQQKALLRILSANKLPQNRAGAIVFAHRLMREFLQGKLLALNGTPRSPRQTTLKALDNNSFTQTTPLPRAEALEPLPEGRFTFTDEDFTRMVIFELGGELFELRTSIKLKLEELDTNKRIRSEERELKEAEVKHLMRLYKFRKLHRDALVSGATRQPIASPQEVQH